MADGQTDREADRKTDRQRGRQKNRQMEGTWIDKWTGVTHRQVYFNVMKCKDIS